VDGKPGRRWGPTDEPGELEAAHPVGADLLDGDAAAIELLGKKVAGVAQAASGDELALGVGVRAGGEADVGIGLGASVRAGGGRRTSGSDCESFRASISTVRTMSARIARRMHRRDLF